MQVAMSAVTAISSSATGMAGRAQNIIATGIDHSTPTPFGDLLTGALGQVNALENQARTAVDGLMTGSGVEVHQAMIATQKADMAFELALSVRNKAVQAYQQVMGMQF